jgi:membrane associated rhomboid family serine protease
MQYKRKNLNNLEPTMKEILLFLLVLILSVFFYPYIVAIVIGVLSMFIIGPIFGVLVGLLIFGLLRKDQPEEPDK